MEVNQDLQVVRDQICNWVLITSAVFGVPATAAILSRQSTIGWHWVVGFHVCLGVLLVLIVCFRKYLSFATRSGFLIGAGITIAVSSMVKFGLVSASIPLLILAPALTAILFGYRMGIYTVLILLACVALTAFGMINGYLTPGFDVNTYFTLKSAWINFFCNAAMAMAIPIAAHFMLEKHLSTALSQARRKRDELELMVEERTIELQQAKLEAEQMARMDELTGLANRRGFLEAAAIVEGQARRHAHPYSVVMIDIDYFKIINDTWGHSGGDAILRTMGKWIRSQFRSTDLSGRLGGEEFAILLPETYLPEAVALAEKLRAKIERTGLHLPEGLIQYTISIGVAGWENSESGLEHIIRQADTALYKAKNSGRNQVVTYAESIAALPKK